MMVFAAIKINKKLCPWGENVRSKRLPKPFPEYKRQLIEALNTEIQKINHSYVVISENEAVKNVEKNKGLSLDRAEILRLENSELLDEGIFVLSFDTGLLTNLTGIRESDLTQEALNIMGGQLLGNLYFDQGLKKLVSTKNADMRKRLKKCERLLLDPNDNENDYSDFEDSFLFGLQGFEILYDSDEDKIIEGFCRDGYFSNIGITGDIKLYDEIFGNLRFKEMKNKRENGIGIIYIYQLDMNNYTQQEFEHDFKKVADLAEQAMVHDDLLNDVIKSYLFINVDPALKLPKRNLYKLRYCTACDYLDVVEVI